MACNNYEPNLFMNLSHQEYLVLFISRRGIMCYFFSGFLFFSRNMKLQEERKIKSASGKLLWLEIINKKSSKSKYLIKDWE